MDKNKNKRGDNTEMGDVISVGAKGQEISHCFCSGEVS